MVGDQGHSSRQGSFDEDRGVDGNVRLILWTYWAYSTAHTGPALAES